MHVGSTVSEGVRKKRQRRSNGKRLSLSAFKVKCCGVRNFEEQHPNATQHESYLTAELAGTIFYFIFFFPSWVNCRRVAYAGMLSGVSCFILKSWASTPPPLLATVSQTLTFLMELGKKAQCAMTVGSDNVKKKLKQLQSESRSADSWFCRYNSDKTDCWRVFFRKRCINYNVCLSNGENLKCKNNK